MNNLEDINIDNSASINNSMLYGGSINSCNINTGPGNIITLDLSTIVSFGEDTFTVFEILEIFKTYQKLKEIYPEMFV